MVGSSHGVLGAGWSGGPRSVRSEGGRVWHGFQGVLLTGALRCESSWPSGFVALGPAMQQ